MPERDDDAKLLQEPIKVTLMGREVVIPLLSYAESRVWREQYAAFKHKAVSFAAIEEKDLPEMLKAVDYALLEMPEAVVDLFFLYAKDLKRDEVERAATEPELLAAAREVFRVASPLRWQSLVSE